MRVKDLKKLLEKVDENRIIIMSKDGEGNGFSPLADLEESSYLADSTWSGEVGIEKLTPVLKKKGYSEEDVVYGKPALVLWPIN